MEITHGHDKVGVACCCRVKVRLLFSFSSGSSVRAPLTRSRTYDVSRSGSMEPAFQRGDILFLSNYDDPIVAGEIVVFKVRGREIPIVHRVIKVHQEDETNATNVQILTKGDNNLVDDRGLYSENQIWLDRDSIMGRSRGSLPYVGMVTILLNDYPNLKYLLVGLMGFFVVTSRE